jgi:hypothetical protein
LRRASKGITLLEIMIAMSLMSVVIIAFASVFPSGYRRNLSTLNQSKAAGYATGVAEQFGNLTVDSLKPFESTPDNPQDVSTANGLLKANPDTGEHALITLPQGLLGPPTELPMENIFFVKSITIVKRPLSDPFGDLNDKVTGAVIPQIVTDEVTVTVNWIETRRNRPNQVKTMAVTTLVNSVIAR